MVFSYKWNKRKIKNKSFITFIQVNVEIDFNDKKIVPETEQTLCALIKKASQRYVGVFQLAKLRFSK